MTALDGCQNPSVTEPQRELSEPLDPRASSPRESIPVLNRQTAVFIFLPRYNTLRRYPEKHERPPLFSAEQAPRSHRTGER